MPRYKIRDFGTALQFNGSTAFVDSTYIPSMPADTDFSISLWAKLLPSNGAAEKCLIGVVGTGTPQIQIAILNGRAFFYATIDGGSSIDMNAETLSMIDGRWHHWALAYNNVNDTAKGYIDGNPIATDTATFGAYTFTRNVYIGGRNNNGTLDLAIAGKIDEVVWYNGYCLTDADVVNIYHSGNYPTAEKAFYYKFDEGSGVSTTDSSGNGETGSITAATYTTDVAFKPRTLIT